MKKIYSSLVAAAVVTGAVAQQTNAHYLPVKKSAEFSNVVKHNGHYEPKGATLWSNTCSDINDWTLTNTSSPSLNWSIETDDMAAPRAEFQPLMFTTVNDGFLFINSDAAGGSATQNATITLASAVTINAAAANLVFDQAYRNFQEVRTVRVSGDNGANWTDFVVHDGSSAVNTNTANPETYVINISSVLTSGADQVLFEFNYQGAWDWFWTIDDIKITELDDHDLRLESVAFGSTGAWGESLPYYQVPTGQVAPVDFSSIVSNIGGVDQTNTVMDVATGSYTGSSAAAFTSVSGATDTLVATTQFTPAATVANHPITFDISSDNTDIDISNNSGATAFDVTMNTYARDNGLADGNSFNSGEAYEVGNIYDMVTADDLWAIDVQVGTASNAGALIYVKLYTIDAATGDFIFADQSDDYTLTQSNVDNGEVVTLMLQGGAYPLNAGESYLVVVGAYGDAGATNDLVTATGGESAAQTTFYFDGTDQTWYYSTSTSAVRMNFDASLAIETEDNNVAVGQNYPNPFNGNTSVEYSLVSTDNVTIEVMDITGKVIAVMNEGTRTAGTHVATINAENLSAGTYFYSVVTSNGKVTKAMTVAK